MPMKWLPSSSPPNPSGSAPVPHYYRIKEYLLEQMKSGTLRFGDRIPTEERLSELFGVSRMTARRAVNDLVREGRLIRKQGVGTFVQAPHIYRQLSKLTTFTEELQQFGYYGLTSRILVLKTFKAHRTLAEQLGISAGEPVHRMKRIKYAEQLPLAVQTVDIPVKYVKEFRKEDLENGMSVYAAAGPISNDIEWAKQSIDAVRAPLCYAKWLEVEPGSPLFKVTRQTYLSDGRPLDFVRMYYRADRYTFQVNLYRDR